MSRTVPGEGQDFLGGLPGSDERCNKQSPSLRQNHDPLLRARQPLTPARGSERPRPPQRSALASGGEAGRGPLKAGINFVFPLTPLRIARPRVPSEGRGGRRGTPRGGASSGGAHGGRETFGGSHFLGRPGGGRCQMPGGRAEGGEAPAAVPPPAARRPFRPWARGRRERRRRREVPGPALPRLAVPLGASLRPAQGFPRGGRSSSGHSHGHPPFPSGSARGSGARVSWCRRRRRL